MKKNSRILATFAILLMQMGNSIAQTSKPTDTPKDTTRKYFSSLANSANPEDKVLLETKLYKLLESADEEDWYLAKNFFYQLKKAATNDSIDKAQKLRFPKGISVRDEEVKLVYDEKDAEKKAAAYEAWIKKFPPQKFGTDRIQYDYARSAVSVAFAKSDKVEKALAYADMLETRPWRGEGWAQTAGALLRNGHDKEAGMLYKRAVDNSYEYITTRKDEYGAGFAAVGYASYSNSYAGILMTQKKYEEALKYVQQAHKNTKGVKVGINSNYAQILTALGRNDEAFEKINEAVKEGQANAEMKEMLKTLYLKVKGSSTGYDEYVASLNKILAEKVRKELEKKIVSKPAPAFILKDVDGNTVSLAGYKGKTVVLDFWATWCGPCKKSFPAMKIAVNRFKEDSTVKFLFIHTWEQADTMASQNAKRYIVDNGYPFEVLMDLKDTVTGVNEIVESYKVSAIPTKFVIDKHGNIRFVFTGFSGGDDAAAEEVAAMIELSRKL